MALTVEVSYQRDIQLNCCIDRMIEGLKKSIWRDWKEAREDGKMANSSGGRILKERIIVRQWS